MNDNSARTIYLETYRFLRKHSGGRLLQLPPSSKAELDALFERHTRAYLAGMKSFNLMREAAIQPEWKAIAARRTLEDLYGDITRPAGFTKSMSDKELFRLMNVSGYGYSMVQQRWINHGLRKLIRAAERNLDIPEGTLPAYFIWGE